MRRHVPSEPDDLDLDARDLAKAAARRAGLSLEEWAATVLAGPDRRPGSSPAQFPQANGIDSIIARMSRTARNKRPAGDGDAPKTAAALGREPQAKDRLGQEQASRTAIALESMAGWIEGAEERLNEAAHASADHQDRVASFLSQALSTLKDRLDAVERHVVSERAAPVRIEFPVQEAMEALAPLSETLVGLRMDMSRLTERLDPSSAWTPAVEGVRAEIEGLRSSMGSLATQEDIAALARAMRDIARDLEPGRSNMDLRTLARSIVALYGQVQALSDETTRGAHQRIGGEIDLIKTKIDRISEAGIDRSVIEALTGQVMDMRQDLAQRAEPQQIARLSEEVAALGRQIADLRTSQLGRGDFSALKASLENVCSALSRTVAAQEAGNVPEQIRHLSQRLDLLVSRPEPEPANLDPIAEQLALLTERMAQLSSRRLEQADALAETLGRLSSQVEAVAEREVPSQEHLMRRFDRIEQELRQVGVRIDASGVESMLRSIDEKLEQAPAAPGLEDLERRIAALPDRLAHAPDKPLGSDEAACIAERAARAVLNDIGAGLPDGGDLGALRQGFVELKALQARADKKTQESLRAIHEALETLMARFPGQVRASQPGLDGARSLPARSAETLPPADRLEAAVRRLHAAALSQIEEASSAASEDVIPGTAAAPATGDAAGFERRRRDASPPSGADLAGADLGHLRASLIATARRAAQNPVTKAAEQTAPPPRDPESSPANGTGEAASSSPSLMERIRRTLDGRSLLLGLTFLVLAAGTARILPGEPGSPSVASLPAKAAQPVQEQPASPVSTAAQVLSALEKASLSHASSLADAPAPSVQGKVLIDPGNIGAIPVGVPAALRQAALSGDAVAVYEVAALAAEGQGFAQDMALAARLYEKAAEAGLPLAQKRLAMMHDKGIGLGRDARLAAFWYERAAQGGNIRAMHNLATLLASGAHGKPDYAAAFRWYGEAAEAGLRDSQFNMGVLLARGIGARQDFAKAFQWFFLAATEGDADAARKRDEIAARLSPADLATARSALAQWRPRPADPVANGLTPSAPGRTAALDRPTDNKS